MKYLRLKTTNPYYNLAVEEYLLLHEDDDIFMLWQNEPTVVIGKNQNAYAEVNLSYVREQGIHVCRRITGGGAVYHDAGNINYTFISKKRNGEHASYAFFAAPILRALETLGLSCSLSGRNDLEYNGRKFSGNAQHSNGARILHHGTILFDTDISVMSAALKVDKEKLAHRAIKSCGSRVINLKEALGDTFGVSDLLEHIEAFVKAELHAEPYSLPSCEEIDALRARNENDAWIYSEKRYLTNYTVQRKKKYPFGLVQIELNLNGNMIEDAVISGDFFEMAPIEELEKALIGCSVDALPYIEASAYISGMTFFDLANLIKP